MSLRILLSLAIVYLGVLSPACAPDRQEPKQQEGATEPAAQQEGAISEQDFETTELGQWQAKGADRDDSSEEQEEENSPTP